MAIYHLSAQVISRGAGRNAVNAAAYRRGACMYDGRTGETFSYVQKRDVLHSEITIPEGAPSWAQALLERHTREPVAAAEELWNRVEAHEKRLDAQLAREIEIALPAELSLEENIGLARLFVTEQLASRGFAADWSIHQGGQRQYPRAHHADDQAADGAWLRRQAGGHARPWDRGSAQGQAWAHSLRLRQSLGRQGRPFGAAGAMGRLREPAFGASRARCPRRSQKPRGA